MSVTDQTARPGHSPVLAELLVRITERVSPERAYAVGEFAKAFTYRMSEDELSRLSAEELFGRVMGAFDLADGRGSAPVAVRVFTPTLAGDGYQTAGSVIETNTDDMPFLFDSVSLTMQARDLGIRSVVHPVIGTERDLDGRIARVLHARESTARESVMHFEIDRHLTPEEIGELGPAIRRVLADVRLTVRDFEAMKSRVGHMIEMARAGRARYAPDEIEETVAFLEWLLDDNFVFLGHREYELIETPEGRALSTVEGSGLGILSDVSKSHYAEPVPLSTIEPELRARIEGGDQLIYSKTNATSIVHRRARMDYIGVRRVAPDGTNTGEARMIGLFTSKAYMEPASRTPLLVRKLKQILQAEDLIEASHDFKAAVAIFESFPKDELFAASSEELRENVRGLLELQEQRQIRLFVRRDIPGRSVSLIVALPRDQFSAELRHKLQDLFVKRFGGTTVDYHLSLGESDPAQIHFLVHVASGAIPDVPFRELEEEVVSLARSWEERVRERLVALHGADRGNALADDWCNRFPDYYKSSTDVYLAVLDILRFQQLESGDVPFVVGLENERGLGENLTRVGLYRTGGKVRLSDFMPILEALGLRVVEEVPTQLLGGDGETYLHDFGVLGPDGKPLALAECADRVAECISAVWRGEAESDSLNRLVVTAGLDWRQVAILRAYRRYRQRVYSGFTEEYQNDAFAANPHIAAKLARLFELHFDPASAEDQDERDALTAEILQDLDAVKSLDQDRILRGHLGLIEATFRTNAFKEGRTSLAFKIRSAAVPDMPKPYPLWEIFVCSPDVEAIHLRGGKVARGGIRWSDRKEDYRTEVLDLMKAQTVKNAVIVPTGSKGGFVLRRPPADLDALREEVRRQYVIFMRGMLDLTDNLVDGEVVRPSGVRVLDEEPDAYLVVAADKGTASFSDTANDVSQEYGFWLGDGFASGGSSGYDHKKLAITARGAWESVKRHFRELGTDVMREPFTVVGIGDMSGDVFGNGMLLSDQIRLVAAFDHRHVFIDPDPDPAVGIAERRRMFELPGSSWEDFDPSKISHGGGVYSRQAKSISLSLKARAALGIDADTLTPNEVIQAILRAPVDLLWNGGIGTYVKASSESHADVGDRTNDTVRVDAKELRCKVVGEGGNLGFTQRGRIEYAQAGGRIHTDFIDNSGGVDCSDHEVNLKILLGLAIQRGDLTLKQRDELLQEAADEIVEHVLYDNYLQAQILSQEVTASPQRMEAYEDLMQSLESGGTLERGIWALPSTDEIAERRRAGQGLTRPELAVLLAFAKLRLVGALVRSGLPDDPYLQDDLRQYFPRKVVDRFAELLPLHPLRRELIATIIANDVVNSEGITFVSRTVSETSAEQADVVRTFRIARDVTGAAERWAPIEALDGIIDPLVQSELMSGVDWLVETTSRWYLANAAGADIGETVAASKDAFGELSSVISRVGSDDWRSERERTVRRLGERGVAEEIARRHAFGSELVHGPDIIAVARESGRSVEEVARAFFLLGESLHIDWLEARLDGMPSASRWHRWALQAMEDDLYLVRRQLTQRVFAQADGRPVQEAVDAFLQTRSEPHARLSRFMRARAVAGLDDLAALTVAVRQIRALVG
ncbi:MAG: NAD-glutamate dehydrogenase [Actinomycetota bacterium]